jgi:hypothetical protein
MKEDYYGVPVHSASMTVLSFEGGEVENHVVPENWIKWRVQQSKSLDDILTEKDIRLKDLQIKQLETQLAETPTTKGEAETMGTTSLVILIVVVCLVTVKFIAPKCTWGNFFKAIVRLIIRPGRAEYQAIKKEWDEANKV